MNDKNCLECMYNRNPVTNNYIIEITLHTYKDIFNDFDSAPIKRRDINPDLKEFIDNCSYNIPLKYNLDLCFFIEKEPRDLTKEMLIIKSLKTYFFFYLNSETRELKQAYKHIAIYSAASFLFLISGFFLENRLGKSIFYNTILEGLNIGGWVFLWEAISFLFINKRKKISDEVKKYRRLMTAPVSFRYNSSDSNE